MTVVRLIDGGSVTVIPLTPETNPDWHLSVENIAALWRDLVDRGEAPSTADDVARFLEAPWRYSAEWQRFCREGVHDPEDAA